MDGYLQHADIHSMQGLAHVWSYLDAACSAAACYHMHAFPDKREADWQLEHN